MPSDPTIPLKEYAQRRTKVLKGLKKSVGIIHAGQRESELHGSWRPNPDFEYLTGITDEPGAMLLLDPGAPAENQQAVLFLRPLDPEIER